MALSPFHISVPITDLASARKFYGDMLGCEEGRSAEMRIDFNFFGHHLVTHVEPEDAAHKTTDIVSSGVKTPVRHFGVVLDADECRGVADRLTKAGARFYLEPQVLHQGQVKEQFIFLVHDGCGNILEFKGIPQERLFAKAL
ncbi:MAG TPA: VOC family protein [Stellaceae bacterium]|nr:VOC family protein [Stellaceae bacterium]